MTAVPRFDVWSQRSTKRLLRGTINWSRRPSQALIVMITTVSEA